MKQTSLKNLIRLRVREMEAYVPGEQPNLKGLIKLNTNENPYPPSPAVIKAISAAVDGRLRLYPNPSANGLRGKLAKIHQCRPENIIVGNGSDELLALATRAFTASTGADVYRRKLNAMVSAATIQYFTPSYSLYPVLSAIRGARPNPVQLNPDFSQPPIRELKMGKRWDFHAALTFITTPNAPSGRGYSMEELDALCRWMKGVVVLDEAYVDFAQENAMALTRKYPHVIVSRTFSKAYSLCLQRIGYFVGHPELIGALHKIRDSYNVNGLGQVAAEATLADLSYYRQNINRVITTREATSARLTEMGFDVLPSQTNFLLAHPPKFPAEQWLKKLRSRKILVRWFSAPEVRNYLRITIGTPSDMECLVKAARAILAGTG